MNPGETITVAEGVTVTIGDPGDAGVRPDRVRLARVLVRIERETGFGFAFLTPDEARAFSLALLDAVDVVDVEGDG